MSRQRKTRKEKIILQLKRELALQQQAKEVTIHYSDAKKSQSTSKSPSRQVAILKRASSRPSEPEITKKQAKKDLFTNSDFLKVDLLKSLGFALVIITLEFVLYLNLGK
ncbi:hypothetical protein ACFLZP_02790 [Patescibacteria group bacterium]